jgi:hypothetical protein
MYPSLHSLLKEAGLQPQETAPGCFVVEPDSPEGPIQIEIRSEDRASWLSVSPLFPLIPHQLPAYELGRLTFEMHLWKLALVVSRSEFGYQAELPIEQVTPLVLSGLVRQAKELRQYSPYDLEGTRWQHVLSCINDPDPGAATMAYPTFLEAAEVAQWRMLAQSPEVTVVGVGHQPLHLWQRGKNYRACLFTGLELAEKDLPFLLAANGLLVGCKLGLDPNGKVVVGADVHCPDSLVTLIHVVHTLYAAVDRVLPILQTLARRSTSARQSWVTGWWHRWFGKK